MQFDSIQFNQTSPTLKRHLNFAPFLSLFSSSEHHSWYINSFARVAKPCKPIKQIWKLADPNCRDTTLVGTLKLELNLTSIPLLSLTLSLNLATHYDAFICQLVTQSAKSTSQKEPTGEIIESNLWCNFIFTPTCLYGLSRTSPLKIQRIDSKLSLLHITSKLWAMN